MRGWGASPRDGAGPWRGGGRAGAGRGRRRRPGSSGRPAAARRLAGLAGHVVELELGLDIDIARDGSARVLYQHDLVNLNEKPLGRVTREVWFQYVDTSIAISPTQHNDRRIVIQRIHDAGLLAKFAFKISPPLQPGERTTVRHLCEGGSFRDALYWREFMARYTRHYTFTLSHQGSGNSRTAPR